MSGLLIATLVASPLPLAELSAADVATRAAGDGALLRRAVERAHWLVDAALTTPPPRPKAELAIELEHLLQGLDGAQAWWGGPAGPDAGAQADVAFALHYAGRLALLSLIRAGADALASAAPAAVLSARSDPQALHVLGPLRRRWRSVRPRLRDRKEDRGHGVGWTIPYIETQSAALAALRRRSVGKPLPSAPATAERLLGGDRRLAEWPLGSAVRRVDVATTAADVRALLDAARPGDLVVASRRGYAGLTPGPSVAVVLGGWKGLDAAFKGDERVARFLGMRGVVSRKPSRYMHLRFPDAARAWRGLGKPAAAVATDSGVTLAPLADAVGGDRVELLRPDLPPVGRLRAVALGAHHVGFRVSGQALLDVCYGAGDGQRGAPGVPGATPESLSGRAGWETVASRPAGP